MSPSASSAISSLSDFAISNVKANVESTTAAQVYENFETTFSIDAKITRNGLPWTREEFKQHWVRSAEENLNPKVHVTQVIEIPDDPKNPKAAGIVGISYIAKSMYKDKALAEHKLPAVERRRVVHLRIETLPGPDDGTDRRRVVWLQVIVEFVDVEKSSDPEAYQI